MILRFIRTARARLLYGIKAPAVIQRPVWPVSMYNVSLFQSLPGGDERGELQ